MRIKAIIAIFVVAIFLAGLGNVLNESVKDVKAGGTLGGGGNILYVGGNGPNNYTKIQDAIDDATNGDTIFVFNGTYYEHITINKTINLILLYLMILLSEKGLGNTPHLSKVLYSMIL